MRSRLRWPLLSAVLLLVALLTVAAHTVPASRLSETLFDFWEETAGPLCVLLVPALIPLAVVLVAQFCLDSGPHVLSKGELDWLIQRKHQGALLHRSRRIRQSAARISRCAQSAGRSAEVGLAPLTAPEKVLDRLVQQKRRGAWAPHVPEAFEVGSRLG